ncbi:MAG: high frequency lysogenization protein HflD [Nitrosopumilus sp.]|jgi:ABC-type nickel/cobalt efflux system permease component RcnA|tara:strand:- start:1243 stop:2001 length:759 start_codon:yes stop_codon:yes gene_type:complete
MIDSLIQTLEVNNPFLIIMAGLMIGLIHAFEPDHISAISTQLLIKNKNGSKKLALKQLSIVSSLRGAVWGMGHTSSIILVGLVIAGLSLNIHNDFFVGAELIVGFMLIVLGILTISNKKIFKQKHIHPHNHSEGISHTHFHNHKQDHSQNHSHKAFLIGSIHGIAGSGSLVALTASTMVNFETMIYFLILFGIGSTIGMTAISGIIGIPLSLLSKIKQTTKYLKYIVSCITFIIGLNIIFTIVLDEKIISIL